MAAGSPSVFADRREAGSLLASAVAGEHGNRPVVVGLARGGVVVAAEVARALGAPLDALAVRKVGHPYQPEYAIGAVTPDGRAYVRAHDGLTGEQVRTAVEEARRRAVELDATLHAERPPLPVAGRTCLLVDDGLATGATMIAAVRWARSRGASRVVAAVPVGAAATLELLREDADDVVALQAPDDFGAVGPWYGDFQPVEEPEVTALLDAA